MENFMLELVKAKIMALINKQQQQSPQYAKAIEAVEEVYIEESFNMQELGYLLQMVTGSKHDGNVLELALNIKTKLQDKIDKLMKNKEAL